MLRQDEDNNIDMLVCSDSSKEQTMMFEDHVVSVKPSSNVGEIDMVAHACASSSGSSLSNEDLSCRNVSVISKDKSTPVQNNKNSLQAYLKCPRCESSNTKFCYYNNYNHHQPRHFCKSCRRYWTEGGALRNVPIGGGCRRNKRTKHRTTFMTSARGVFEPSSYIENNDVNVLAPFTTNFPCFAGPSNFEEDNGRVSLLNMDPFSYVKEAMHATHLVSPSSFLGMGPLDNTFVSSCRVHHCHGTDSCTCASCALDASTGYKVMPTGLIEQGMYNTFYEQGNLNTMVGPSSSATISPLVSIEDRFASVSNVLPLNYLPPNVCNATIFEHIPQLQELPEQEGISLTHFSQEVEGLSLNQCSRDSKDVTFDHVKQEEESGLLNRGLKEGSLQFLFDDYDDQLSHGQHTGHIKDFSEMEGKMMLEGLEDKEMLDEKSLIKINDVSLLQRMSNEVLLSSEAHSNASLSHLRLHQDMQALSTTKARDVL